MAVAVPYRCQMPQELPAAGLRQVAPERLGVGADAVDNIAPVTASGCMTADKASEPAGQEKKAAANGNIGERQPQRCAGGVRLRQQSAAGQRDEGALVAALQQRGDPVDGRKAGADEGDPGPVIAWERRCPRAVEAACAACLQEMARCQHRRRGDRYRRSPTPVSRLCRRG